MLSQEKNERLTAVGPGTPMGNLLRRYWWPVATHDMAGRVPVRRRLLGEDLVLFRDGSGQLGLLAEQCPHRRASLALGCTERTGLRCGYHGWLFGADGRCLEQPGEPADSTFASRIRAASYPVAELGGLIFAYLGPAPAPLLPRYDLFVWPDVWRDIAHAELPCNFVQIMENSVDPYHVEWLHGRYGSFLRELAGEPAVQVVTKKHVKVAFEVFEHGILKRRLLEGQTEQDEDWKTGHPLVFPAMLRVGGGGIATFQIRVPVDDTHTWHVWYQTYRFDEPAPPQAVIPVYPVPLHDSRGEWLRDYVDGHDICAWVTQGRSRTAAASTWAVRISVSSCSASCTSSRWSGSRRARTRSACSATRPRTTASTCRWSGRSSAGPGRSATSGCTRARSAIARSGTRW
jgi:5,5'-dehydrodivanillate O-demethylase oxygenase subunit